MGGHLPGVSCGAESCGSSCTHSGRDHITGVTDIGGAGLNFSVPDEGSDGGVERVGFDLLHVVRAEELP